MHFRPTSKLGYLSFKTYDAHRINTHACMSVFKLICQFWKELCIYLYSLYILFLDPLWTYNQGCCYTPLLTLVCSITWDRLSNLLCRLETIKLLCQDGLVVSKHVSLSCGRSWVCTPNWVTPKTIIKIVKGQLVCETVYDWGTIMISWDQFEE